MRTCCQRLQVLHGHDMKCAQWAEMAHDLDYLLLEQRVQLYLSESNRSPKY